MQSTWAELFFYMSDCSLSIPGVFLVPGRPRCPWPAEPVRDWHVAQDIQACVSPVVSKEAKINTTGPVVCQLGGYNYLEDGGEVEKEFLLQFCF